MGIGDFFRRIGSKIVDGGRHVFGAISRVAPAVIRGAGHFFGGARKVADTVRNVYDKVSNIPVIGNAVRQGAEKLMAVKVPRTNISIGQALSTGDRVVREGDKLLNRK
jgi:hypothetical protein